MARADFAASVKSYSRPLFYRRICVRVTSDTKARTRAGHCVRATNTRAGPRAWAVDFSKHIITESQLHDASDHGNGAIR